MQDSIQTGANANSDLKKIPFTKYSGGYRRTGGAPVI